MQRKTIITAEANKQEIIVTRTFDLPLPLLFTAYTIPDLIEQWMGTKVLKLDSKNHGSYLFETTDPMGNKHQFHGTIHTIVPDVKIIRTFEMGNNPFDVQLEFLDFESCPDNTSKLTMHIVFRTVMDRDNRLKMPFEQGINMAHNRLQQIVTNLK